jgi:hypothetical protein
VLELIAVQDEQSDGDAAEKHEEQDGKDQSRLD